MSLVTFYRNHDIKYKKSYFHIILKRHIRILKEIETNCRLYVFTTRTSISNNTRGTTQRSWIPEREEVYDHHPQ
jgi:hypothetical protein